MNSDGRVAQSDAAAAAAAAVTAAAATAAAAAAAESRDHAHLEAARSRASGGPSGAVRRRKRGSPAGGRVIYVTTARAALKRRPSLAEQRRAARPAQLNAGADRCSDVVLSGVSSLSERSRHLSPGLG